MRVIGAGLYLLLITAPGASFADEATVTKSSSLRELCAERPGLTTPACTVDPGHVQVEIGLADWQRVRSADERMDQVTGGDLLVRYGLASQTELQVSWTGYVRTVTRNYRSGDRDRSHDIGDATLGLKQNILHPQEKARGLALAVLSYVSIPVGTGNGGDGDWGAGAVVPLSYKFSDLVTLAVSPRLEAAVDEDGSGRHLAYGAAAGLQFTVLENLRLSPELEMTRDRDPQRKANLASGSVSLAWRVGKTTQFDMQGVAGLNAAAPDLRIAFGLSHKF